MRAERDKPPPKPSPIHDKRSPDAYRAQVVPPGALRHFVRVHGGGQRAIAWIAGRQLSVVTRTQLYDAGLTRDMIGHQIEIGSLHRCHRGVYLVGSPIAPPGGVELAALFACGDAALISHRSAAALWDLIPTQSGPIDVTLVGANRRDRAGINVHRVGGLHRQDRQTRRGIPVTSPARTLIDFSADAEDDELEAAVSEGRALKLIGDGDLERAIDRAGPRTGVARIRALLRSEGDNGYTRSKAERIMCRLARQGGLPQPLCNQPMHGYKLDFFWPEQGLVVEVDGYQFHGHRSAFERDRRKDQQVLIAAGYRVVHVTWRQLTQEPIRVIAVIAAALTARRSPG